ncbi:MAG: hypothetical protein V3U84_07035 [Thiotrichaceae bacterium]
MAYVATTVKEQRTPSVKKADRQRDFKRRQRKQSSGRPGRKSAEQRQKQAEVMRSVRERKFKFLSDLDLPDLTGQQRDIVNILIQPDVEVLTNIQIARLAGVTRDTVGSFRGSYEYYKSLAKSDVFEKRLVRLEAKVMVGIEKNIEKHCDNTSMKFILTMRQRMDEAHRNIFQINANTVLMGVGQALANLPEAEYTVIEEEKDDKD